MGFSREGGEERSFQRAVRLKAQLQPETPLDSWSSIPPYLPVKVFGQVLVLGLPVPPAIHVSLAFAASPCCRVCHQSTDRSLPIEQASMKAVKSASPSEAWRSVSAWCSGSEMSP
jgi:hypothetical protein